MPPDPACRGVKRLVDATPSAAAEASSLRREQGEDDSSGAAKRIRCEAHALATDMVSRVSGPASEWGYKGKTILAPMVRVGTLPMRLLARGYGADIVYSEELIDHRLLRCQRVVDAPLPVTSIDQLDIHGFPRWVRPTRLVRYVLQNEQKVKTGLERNVFITYENEPVVLQLGTGDATRALRAAQTVAQDVCAIDINMGCPLSFSVKGGMGSALLGKPEVMHDIVSTLKRNLPIPVTIKIRLLEDEFALLELGRRAEMAGADAVAIHARYISDRSNTVAARWAKARPLKDALNIPMVANGDVFTASDVASIYQATAADSVMIARGAMWNPSVFLGASAALRAAQDGKDVPGEVQQPLPLYDVVRSYLGVAGWVGNHFQNTKYCVLEMMKGHSRITTAPVYQSHFIGGKSISPLQKGLSLLADAASAQSHAALCGPYRLPRKIASSGNG